MKSRSKCHVYIGIDGGVKTGVAIYLSLRDSWTLMTTDFWGAYEKVLTYAPSRTLVVVEDPSQVSPVYHRRANTRRAQDKVAERVGGVKRESLLLMEGLKRAGYTVQGAYVRGGQYQFLGSKLSAEEFTKLTGYTERSSQHARDAGRILMYACPNIIRRFT